jgi:hypothetical protein
MDSSRFKVVFEKLSEISPTDEAARTEQVSFVREELDEIAELRRLALEIAEPEPRSYTVT